ncbi:hypothetical protein [Nostoc sp.]|uniref:hypothetical protein n=1 Tax=Nostoc sp. TaxID=1180 RepID=UPI002FF79DBE
MPAAVNNAPQSNIYTVIINGRQIEGVFETSSNVQSHSHHTVFIGTVTQVYKLLKTEKSAIK